MRSFPLTISSPDGSLFDGEITALSLRGTEGELAVMAGHVPFITAVRPGHLHLDMEDGTRRSGQTTGGILTVASDKTTLLTGSVQWE